MNQELLDKFIENVKAGKVPGLTVDEFCDGLALEEGDWWQFVDTFDRQPHADWLCAAIRRALAKMGYPTWLGTFRLELHGVNSESFTKGTELDIHLAAINWAAEQTK
jgi:hypothetical protein